MLEEEAHHLATSVGPAWLGVRSGTAAAGPGVAGSVKNPLLYQRSPTLIFLNDAGVTHSSGCLTAGDGGPEIRGRFCLGDDLIPIDGAYDRVTVTVKHDGRNAAARSAVPSRFPCAERPAPPHRFESGRDVGRGSARQSGMHADGRIEVRLCRSHDCCCGASGRQAGDIYATRLDRKVVHDLASDPGNQRWLALIAVLVVCVEPVPALGNIG
jgi:hypothetical protein